MLATFGGVDKMLSRTWSNTVRPSYCSHCTKSFASAGKRELYLRTWGTPISLPYTKTRARGTTVTTTGASRYTALSAKYLLGSYWYAPRSWRSVSTQSNNVASVLTVNTRNDLLPSTVTREVQRTVHALVHRIVDLTKAFDLASRDGLFKVLPKIGCPPKLQSMIESFHTDTKGRVQFNGSFSEQFEIRSGVKQGCVLDQMLFGTFFGLLLKHVLDTTTEGIIFRTCSDDRLFNLARLRAKTKVRKDLIRDMLFADDAAVATHTHEELLSLMDCFSQACKDFGLTISLKKTNVLGQDT